MIRNLKLLHYLSEDTYKNICQTLDLDDSESKTKENFISYPDKPIFRIHPFNIIYKQFGHIWFLNVFVDFPKFQCDYTSFNSQLFDQYKKLFGKIVMKDFPVFEQIICEYVEFYNIYEVPDADSVEKEARKLGCPPVNPDLDIGSLTNANKPHGKIEFCISKKDDKHIETLAHCFGTALKKRIKDKSFHGPVGIKTAKIVNRQTEEEIVNWLLHKHNFSLRATP
jgi:hypothetical protein